LLRPRRRTNPMMMEIQKALTPQEKRARRKKVNQIVKKRELQRRPDAKLRKHNKLLWKRLSILKSRSLQTMRSYERPSMMTIL
jgi:hypothetical protein